MRLYEWEAKRLLADRGVPVPAGATASSSNEAWQLAERWGDAVLKAQVLHGGRMKAGLVQFADGGASAAEYAKRLLGARPRGVRVHKLLVEQRLEVEQERFVAALYDPRSRGPVLIYSPRGGIDVERDSAGSIARVALDARAPVQEFRLRAALRSADVAGRDLRPLTAIAVAVARMFIELDATLIEINPLAKVSERGWMALDAHIELDGDALARHGDLVQRFELDQRGDGDRPPSPAERAAQEVDALDHRGVAGRLVELDGDLALIIGGGGASLTVIDAIRAAGGRPANYCEVGGNPSVSKIAAFTKLLLERLSPRRVAVIMNVVSNTRADLVARGVIKGCIQAGRQPAQTLAVFRVPGAWEQESRELLEHYGVTCVGRDVSLDAAARLAVEAAAA